MVTGRQSNSTPITRLGRLAEVVEAGPVDRAVDGACAGGARTLGAVAALGDVRHLARRDHIRGSEFKALGFVISARPRHFARAGRRGLRQTSPPAWRRSGRGSRRRRISCGGKMKPASAANFSQLCGPDVARGGRPATSAPNGPIFRPICPAKGKGAGLVAQHATPTAMPAHLIEISAAVDCPAPMRCLSIRPVGLERPSWRTTNTVLSGMPATIARVEPGPNVWQFNARPMVVEPWIFKSYEDFVALCWRLELNLSGPTMVLQPDHVPRHAQMAAWV